MFLDYKRMFSQTLISFAKINVGLRVLNKREDSYHDLETIFYPIKLYDEISIDIQKSDSNYNSVILKSNKPYIPLTKDNLCYKAIEIFFKNFKIKECYKINLNIKKSIPVGGGLGGGSSNAAAVLKFLIKYFNIDINANRKLILDLALSIGSDVPFFLLNKPCYAEGRGEKMSVLPEFKIDYDILVINPNVHVSTKWAFEKLNLIPGQKKDSILKGVQKFELNNIDKFKNDFEDIVLEKYGILRQIKEELIKMGAVFSSMSGSGATMYGIFDKENKDTLKKCDEYYSSKKYFTFISV
ncbi:MAG: 4-(cytidine 5'-diphospho)-2-C-methyl-D-erythritol kinase [Bacteroidota bacterium]|nr:4-(cytidine 5'-diphospho)-2-C-methyl-D-erythritol kinase [Bacteroidota bacterium]